MNGMLDKMGLFKAAWHRRLIQGCYPKLRQYIPPEKKCKQILTLNLAAVGDAAASGLIFLP